MTQLLSHPPFVPCSTADDWMHDRLTEARGILADMAQHPDTLVIFAARVVISRTDDTAEYADTVALLQKLDPRSVPAVDTTAQVDATAAGNASFISVAAPCPNGGAA
ncbi:MULTISPECIES: hypothetical protein [unclassified Yoonia]|uniref:hypothetical protein n=1 Tax=unclassified Yoonia TaxID=2629118 RepID=UPI002AFFD5DF|nr:MULTISPECIES: hypothetical protein [unclassified Yoonia]